MQPSSQVSNKVTPARRLELRALAVPAGSDVDFGVECSPGRASLLSDAEFAELERAVLTHHVVVIRDQGTLRPNEQFELTRRFDPLVESYGHGNRTDILAQSVLVQDLVSIPDTPQVKLLGNGRVTDHEGLADVRLRHPSHHGFHHSPLSDEQTANGLTRFYRWHIDAALYELHPPRVTTLLALRVPADRPQTVVYDDGTGDTLDVPLGTTAFVSGETAFQILSDEQKRWAKKTLARYAPHPYVWMKNARSRSNGLGLVTEGKELPRDELPAFDEEKRTTLPLVWENPVTFAPSLQVHPYCVEQLIVDGERIDDLAECRRLLYEIIRPAIVPSRVYAHPWKAGDLVIFNNRAVWHSVVGSLTDADVRVYHQCNLASNVPPRGPRSTH